MVEIARRNEMKIRISFAVLAIILLSSMSVMAETNKDDIKKRMKERFPILNDLKKLGKIGETHLGFVEAIDPKDQKDVGIQKLLSDENDDRKLLYKLIAQQTEAKPKMVGRQNAFRLFNKAKDDEYFKGADGKWRQKKDMKVEKQEEEKKVEEKIEEEETE
jgi:uncharacterized protein YdbL (DUF1318 family)